jgi:hypothetical protein
MTNKDFTYFLGVGHAHTYQKVKNKKGTASLHGHTEQYPYISSLLPTGSRNIFSHITKCNPKEKVCAIATLYEPQQTILLNVMVKWLTFWLCIWEVLGSNLGPETCYPD